MNGHDRPELFDPEDEDFIAGDPDYAKWRDEREAEAISALDADIEYAIHVNQMFDHLFNPNTNRN